MLGQPSGKREKCQSTCSHHVRKLAEVGFLRLTKAGTTTRVSINQACCSGLPHAADADGLWTLQTSILTENRASIALHHCAGYRTVGIRERIAQIGGTWHDTVLLERRAGTTETTIG